MRPRIEIIYVPRRKGISFSDTEIRQFLISAAVLVFAFTLMLWSFGHGFPILLALTASLLAVGTGFILHEMAHKFTAQRFMCWAEYRYAPLGLLLTVISALAGFLIAAPGAVYIAGNLSKRENAIISLAGPGTNLVIGALTLPVAILIPPGVRELLLFVAYINLFLGIFNMLPVPPLDGSKIYPWNRAVYIGVFAALIALIIPVYLLLTGWLQF